MLYREVVKEAFYNMISIREEYKINCKSSGLLHNAIVYYIEM